MQNERVELPVVSRRVAGRIVEAIRRDRATGYIVEQDDGERVTVLNEPGSKLWFDAADVAAACLAEEFTGAPIEVQILALDLLEEQASDAPAGTE